jgi:hypothetical protein
MDNELRTHLEGMEGRIIAAVGGRTSWVGSDRYSYTLQEHEQWLRDHTRAIAKHREWIEEHEATMRRVEHNLELLSNLILRGRGSNGGSPEPGDQ